MTYFEDRKLTSEERAEIAKRKLELELKRKSGAVDDLADLKKDLGIKDKKD